METASARKLASQGNLIGRKIGFTGKPDLLRKRIRRKNDLAGKIALQASLFLANHTKTIIVILVVKHITYVVKVLSIRTSWFFFQKVMQIAVIGKKKNQPEKGNPK